MSETSTIVVFGATGACGRAVIEQSMQRGHPVTAFVRNPQKAAQLFADHSGKLQIVQGDIDDAGQIAAAVARHDVIISCLSSFEPPHLGMSRFTQHVISAAQHLERPNLRFIAYGLCGVADDGDRVSHTIQNVLRVFSPGKFGPAIRDHRRVIALLEASALNYTLFQTATMVDQPLGKPYVSGSPERLSGVRLWDRWNVRDAADVCLDALNEVNLPRLQMRYS